MLCTLEGASNLEVGYSPEIDILVVRHSVDPSDYAKETKGVIAHFHAAGKPVLLEIQGARELLQGSITSLVEGEEVSLS